MCPEPKKQFFYRIEHDEYINHDLTSLYSHNCENNKDFVFGLGPWSAYEGLLTYEELSYMSDISAEHHLPYPKVGYPFDWQIYNIVKGSPTQPINFIKQNYIFGCQSKLMINEYFPPKLREILSNHDFVMTIYCSEHVYSSYYQSVLDISKPFYYLGWRNLTTNV